MSGVRLRLIPAVMMAAGALLALKLVGVTTHAGELFAASASAAAAEPEDDAGRPAGHRSEEAKAAAADAALPDSHGTPEGARASSRPVEKPPVDASGRLATEASSERALVEALAKRREAITERESGLDQRETLLKATEKRLDERLAELKRMEDAIAAADKRRAEEESGKLKELVSLYEGMKPKEAARIFDKLDGQVLLDVASRMKPRSLSVVMGLMAPEGAQKLTVALARREAVPPVAEIFAETELPKIEGKPTRR